MKAELLSSYGPPRSSWRWTADRRCWSRSWTRCDASNL